MTPAMKQTLFNRIDVFFEQHSKWFVFAMIAVNLSLAFLFFDLKVSLSGDDADYILYARKFVEDFSWPGFRGPLYPILLSPFIALFGIHLILLKSLSALCILCMLYFLHKSFYKRIPALVLFPTLTLLSVNGYLLFYESQTFSEPLFMLLQTIFFFLFIKYFITPPAPLLSENKQIKYYLAVAFLALLVVLTRTVGYVAVGVVVIYFLINRQWKKMLYAFLGILLCFGSFNVLKQLIWPGSGGSYALSAYLVKDMYNPTKGMETLSGFVTRFVKNAEGYLSRDLVNFMGLRAESTPPAEVSTILAIVLMLLFMAALWMTGKKNKPLLFTGLYTLMLCGAHFILLQANWQQERFMLVLYPAILLVFLGGLYYALQPYRKWQFLLPLFAVVLFFGTLSHTFVKLERHIPVLQRNLRNDPLYGYTPDWRNFILMSQWAAGHVPPSAVIVSRKPSISCIYGNRDFAGIFSVPAVENSKFKNVTAQPPGKFLIVDISTVQFPALSRYMQYVASGKQFINGKEVSLAAIYEMQENDLPPLLSALREDNINFTLDHVPVFEHIAANNNILCYSPDDLYNNLRDRNIQYMIMASIRINPAKNTGNIITTLHRYINFVSLKYPHVVKQTCHTIGVSEPASLIELQYLGAP
jgi:hypothetical protein